MPSRLAAVCALMFGVQIAYAERRPVAVIDLSGDSKTAKLASDVHSVLLGHPDLLPIPDPAIVPELYGEFPNDDFDRIEAARNAKQTAEQRLGLYEFRDAEQSTANGLGELEQAMPIGQSLLLYAQLSFVRGQALLGIRGRANDARESLALAHRLDPAFVPDAARYLPDVIQAFNAAKTAWTGSGKLDVVGSGRLWIDGVDSGSAPAELEVPAGPHVVWLTGDRVTTAKRVVVEAGKKTRLEIEPKPLSARQKVRRARAALRNAPDSAARAAAMKQIAALVGVRDAVLLSSANNKIIFQTWCEGACTGALQGFSALRELRNEKPIDLLTSLAPPKPPKKQDDPGTQKKPVVDTREWYEKRPYQAGIVAGVLAAIIGSYFIYQSLTDDTVTASGDFDQAARLQPGLRW